VRGRKLPVKPVAGQPSGIETPLELTGPLHGVHFELPRGVYGLLDCRMALLLDDLAEQLSVMGIVGVEVNNIYRPGSELPLKSGEGFRSTAKPTRPKPVRRTSSKRRKPPPKAAAKPLRPSQHAFGLAIDIMEFRLADGRTLNVERDWHGTLGAPVCGPGSQVTDGDAAGILLRNVTCAISRAGLCNHLITPNRDEAHRNHLHCDIAPVHEIEVE
jgi:hypothetical protein